MRDFQVFNVIVSHVLSRAPTHKLSHWQLQTFHILYATLFRAKDFWSNPSVVSCDNWLDLTAPAEFTQTWMTIAIILQSLHCLLSFCAAVCLSLWQFATVCGVWCKLKIYLKLHMARGNIVKIGLYWIFWKAAANLNWNGEMNYISARFCNTNYVELFILLW